MTNQWDQRYATEEYVYGTEPNVFFKSQIEKISPGKVLMVAEGEGRNAVYAAQLGWQVVAFDISSVGKEKADKLAASKAVEIDYQVGEFAQLEFEAGAFDAVAVIFAHFSVDQKIKYLQRLVEYLKPGGLIIFEGYDKAQLNYRKSNNSQGGPANIDALYSVDELQQVFTGLEIILLRDEEVELQEGSLHTGVSRVVRFVGRKPA